MAENSEKQKEEASKIAMTNLKDGSLNALAVAHFAKNEEYGRVGKLAVHNELYVPTLQKNSDILVNHLFGSRADGELYSGNISESRMIRDCAGILQESLMVVRVEDVLKLIGSDVSAADDYAGKYVSELDEKVAKQVIGGYFQRHVDEKVSEALGEQSKSTEKGLESLLSGASDDYESALAA